MNCNQAECEWNRAGDRAIIKISSDVDRVRSEVGVST